MTSNPRVGVTHSEATIAFLCSTSRPIFGWRPIRIARGAVHVVPGPVGLDFSAWKVAGGCSQAPTPWSQLQLSTWVVRMGRSSRCSLSSSYSLAPVPPGRVRGRPTCPILPKTVLSLGPTGNPGQTNNPWSILLTMNHTA